MKAGLYNTGSDVLGVLIARASAQPIEIFFRERIFEPLGMKDTSFSVPAGKLDRFATRSCRLSALAGRHGAFGDKLAAVAGIAGVKKAVEQGIIGGGERVLTVRTGSGLKDTVSAMKAAGQPIQIDADLEAVAAGIDTFQKAKQK